MNALGRLTRTRMVLKLFVSLFVFSFYSSSASGFWFKLPKPHEEFVQLGKVNSSLLPANDIDVLVWNMYKGKKASWQRDFKSLTKDKEILILQEGITDKGMLQTFQETSDFESTLATSFIMRFSRKKTGVVTGATARPLSTFSQRSRNREQVGWTPKVVLFKLYKIRNHPLPLMIINIHALNSVTAKVFSQQIEDIANVMDLHQGPVIFAGDFNTWSAPKYFYLIWRMQISGMENVNMMASENRMHTFGYPLDHVFVRDLEVTSAKVMGDIEGSDHKPIVLRVSPI